MQTLDTVVDSYSSLSYFPLSKYYPVNIGRDLQIHIVSVGTTLRSERARVNGGRSLVGCVPGGRWPPMVLRGKIKTMSVGLRVAYFRSLTEGNPCAIAIAGVLTSNS